MFDFMKRKELEEIESLKATIANYRENDKIQHDEIKRLKEFELKCKIMEMYIDDDEAILELLDCEKENKEMSDQEKFHRNIHMIREQAMNNSLMGGFQYNVMGNCMGQVIN